MNIIKFAVIFTLISLPFYFITDYRVQSMLLDENIKEQYETIINNAIEDGTLALRLFTKESIDQTHKKQLNLDQKEVLNAFLASYHYGFKAISKEDKQKVNQYILGIVIIDYNGYYIYGTKEVVAENGSTYYKQVLSEKIPFVYETNDNVLFMTLDNYITVINKNTWNIEEGYIEDILVLPEDIEISGYNDFRKVMIGRNIENALQKTVKYHNKNTKIQGISYEFYLPIADNDFDNIPISDVGLLVFIQGQPIGNKGYLEMSSLNQGSVLSRVEIVGYKDINTNSLYYCIPSCVHEQTDTKMKVFQSTESAAKEGYYPCHYLGK